MRVRIALTAAWAAIAVPAAAQTPLSRADAVRTALDRGARLAVSRADTAVANAAVTAAAARPNPTLSTSYSKSLPNYHVNVDLPIQFPMLRRLKLESARAGLRAAQLKYQFDRAMIAMDADTAYTRAVAAREKLTLSRRNALDADSLLHMVERRRDAGDASDLDVELARVNAGQQANVAADDSLTVLSVVLDLQAALGMSADVPSIQPIDSLTAVPPAASPAGQSLDVAAASASLDAASLNARLEHRSIWTELTVSLGFEFGDPDQHGLLPTAGIGIGLPIFDRNRGAIAQAEAERTRAQAELTLAQVEARNALAHALRERESAVGKVARDASIVAAANRVAQMSLTGYREGAMSLPNVLEAQRSAREVLAQYIDDLAAAWVATAELRVFSLSPATVP